MLVPKPRRSSSPPLRLSSSERWRLRLEAQVGTAHHRRRFAISDPAAGWLSRCLCWALSRVPPRTNSDVLCAGRGSTFLVSGLSPSSKLCCAGLELTSQLMKSPRHATSPGAPGLPARPNSNSGRWHRFLNLESAAGSTLTCGSLFPVIPGGQSSMSWCEALSGLFLVEWDAQREILSVFSSKSFHVRLNEAISRSNGGFFVEPLREILFCFFSFLFFFLLAGVSIVLSASLV